MPFKPAFLAGRSQSFDSSAGPDGKVRVDLWDRFTSWGEKIKEGRLSVFDQSTLGQMLDNWQKRGDRLSMCFNHQSAYVAQNGRGAPALAFYDALAIVMGGEVIRVAVLPGSRAPGGTFESAARGDGLYGFRCEVTPLGEDPREGLRNFKYISPMFTSEGADEQGREIGYVLHDVAATNTPFQAGCEITFDAGAAGSLQGETMNKLAILAALLTKKYAIKFDAKDDDDKIKQSALSKMGDEAAKAMDDDAYNYDDGAATLEEMAKAYEDAEMKEDGEGEAPHLSMRKLASGFRKMSKKMSAAKLEKEGNGGPGQEPTGGQKPGGVSEEDKAKLEETKKAAEMSAFAQRLGIKLPTGATSAQMFQAIEASAVPASQIPMLVEAQVKRTLMEQDQKRVVAETVEKAKALVQAMEGYPEANKAALLSFASDPKTFDAAVAIAKPFIKNGAESQLFSRMTAGGSPVALAGDAARASSSPVAGRKLYETPLATFVVDDEAIAAEVCRWADAKDGAMKMEIDALLSESERDQPDARWIAADRLVRTKKNPELWEQTRRAQLNLY